MNILKYPMLLAYALSWALGCGNAAAITVQFDDLTEGMVTVTETPPGSGMIMQLGPESVSWQKDFPHDPTVAAGGARAFLLEPGTQMVVMLFGMPTLVGRVSDVVRLQVINNPANQMDTVILTFTSDPFPQEVQLAIDFPGLPAGFAPGLVETGGPQDLTMAFIDEASAFPMMFPVPYGIQVIARSDIDVPEPASAWLWLCGAGLLMLVRRLRQA